MPVIDSESLKPLHFSYALVIGTFKIIFKSKNVGNKSSSYFSEGFFLAFSFYSPSQTLHEPSPSRHWKQQVNTFSMQTYWTAAH